LVIETTEIPPDRKLQIANHQPFGLTAIVSTFNEETNIEDCLASIGFADEILVVDSFSTDRTVELARAFPRTRVLQHAYEGNGPQCNWAMDRAAHPWVLIVDADERVTPELAREIETVLGSNPKGDQYRLRRQNLFLGRVIHGSGWGRDRLVRLLRRGSARYPEQRVHADIATNGPVPTLSAPLRHFTCRSLGQYVEKLHRYAQWGAADLAQRGRSAGWKQIALRPVWRFFRSFVLEAGFLDGVYGLVLCGLQAYGVFLKWAELWEMQKKEGRGGGRSRITR
jgi:glycosyltransferase involved in cell wall biosynthesis